MEVSDQSRILDEWLGLHKGLIFKVVHAYAFTSHDRDDLFQEIATQIWNSIPRFRGESVVATWLYRVALNSALNWSHRERKHRERTEPLEGHEPALKETSRAKDERLGWLYERISEFDHVDRSLTLLLLDGCSYRAMAETLGISESYVGVKINRIKARLRDLTKEEHALGI
ncbi:RNA polymerase sigma factor [soil metagenome]